MHSAHMQVHVSCYFYAALAETALPHGPVVLSSAAMPMPC